jgi:hypothetical protein
MFTAERSKRTSGATTRERSLIPNWEMTLLLLLAFIPILLSGCASVGSESAPKGLAAPLGESFSYPPVGSLVVGATDVLTNSGGEPAETNAVQWCPLTMDLSPCYGPPFTYAGLNNQESGDAATAIVANQDVTIIGGITGYDNPTALVNVVTNVNGTTNTTSLGKFGSTITDLTLPNATGSFLVAEQNGHLDLCTLNDCNSPPS